MSERKYRQRGYQDSDRERSPSGPRRAPGERPAGPTGSGPRGRGLGKPTATVFRCAACGQKQLDDVRVEQDTTCRKCGADLHTCTHCRHFDPSAPAECRKPVTRRVAAKARRNDCRLFEVRATREFASPSGADSPADARAAFDALFKI